MSLEIKFFLMRLATLIVLTPPLGFVLMRYFEYAEKVWKTGNRVKRWGVVCTFFFFLALAGGFLR